MTKFFVIAVAAVLMQAALSVADAQSTDSRAKSSSFVPHPHSSNHVYGAPMQPAIVGHSKVSNHKHTLKKRLSNPKKQA